MGATFAVAGGGGGGITTPTAATSASRRQSATAFSSRSSSFSSWRGRPVANALAAGVAGGRGRVAVMMSMAEEERGGNNAVLGALAIAGLGAVYYG